MVHVLRPTRKGYLLRNLLKKEVSNLSKAAKALIVTWLMIGLFIAGAVGFYLGRVTAPKSQSQNAPTGQQPTGGQQPNSGQQSPPRGASPSAAPSGPSQGGQQGKCKEVGTYQIR